MRAFVFCLVLLVGTPSARAQATDEATLRSTIQGQATELLKGLVGPSYFSMAVVRPGQSLPGRASSDGAGSPSPAPAADQSSLFVYGPDFKPADRATTSGGAAAPRYRFEIEVFLQSEVPETTRTELHALIRSLSPEHELAVRIRKVAKPPLPVVAKPEAERSPASTEMKAETAEGAPWWAPYALPAALFSALLLAALILGSFVVRAFGSVSASLRQFNSPPNARTEPARPAPPASTNAAAPPPRPDPPILDLALRHVSRNQDTVRDFLLNKVYFFARAIGEEADADLPHLRLLGPRLSPEEREALRRVLGPRAALVAASSSVESVTASARWLSHFAGKLAALEMAGASALQTQLSPDDTRLLLSLTPADLDALANVVSELEDPQVWTALVEILPDSLLEGLLGRLPASGSAPLGELAEVPPSQAAALLRKAMARIESIKAKESRRGPSAELLEKRVIPNLARAYANFDLEEETKRWDELLAAHGHVETLVLAHVWPLFALARIPETKLRACLSSLETSPVAYLWYVAEKTGKSALVAAIAGGLPESTRKTIIQSEFEKFKRQAPSADSARDHSQSIRRAFEDLRRSGVALESEKSPAGLRQAA